MTPGHKSGSLEEGFEADPQRLADLMPMEERQLLDEHRTEQQAPGRA